MISSESNVDISLRCLGKLGYSCTLGFTFCCFSLMRACLSFLVTMKLRRPRLSRTKIGLMNVAFASYRLLISLIAIGPHVYWIAFTCPYNIGRSFVITIGLPYNWSSSICNGFTLDSVKPFLHHYNAFTVYVLIARSPFEVLERHPPIR